MHPRPADAFTEDRIVIYRLGSIGDTVVALPCFHKIAQHFPNAERILLTNFSVSAVAAPLESILGESKLISRSIEYTASSRSVRELLAVRRRLRSTGARTLVYLAASRGLMTAWRDLIFFRICGFKRVIGVPLTRDLQDNRTQGPTGFVEPECERLARTLASLGSIDLHDRRMWDLLLSPEEMAAGDGVKSRFNNRPFMAVHVGGKAAAKDWGDENWRRLLQALSRHYGDSGLLFIGASEDSARYRGLASAWPGLIVDACGELTPRQCAAALRHAQLFVGHDSGPLHLAAISGVPCVGLFGSFNAPVKWHPYVGTRRIIHCMEGISKISVEEVLQVVRDLWPDR